MYKIICCKCNRLIEDVDEKPTNTKLYVGMGMNRFYTIKPCEECKKIDDEIKQTLKKKRKKVKRKRGVSRKSKKKKERRRRRKERK
tara:strand:+ start:33869 stop:34126 length:258 start_codon:yes stop_codon:yes gene_type:complete